LKPKERSGVIPVAEYVRMSTEHQQYSIANQHDVISQYATDHGMAIVRTYSDAAKSGVTLQRRTALQGLLEDVEKGAADYSAILVYDVSRWGRFQDVDESAYYEYRCKRANIAVHYCAEPFVNDGSVSSALLKAIKRAMAGEYSRELSVKVFAGKCRLVEAGFRGGGAPGYGLRRLLIDPHGNPKGILKRGEFKSIATDRTVQVPGPPEEIAMVREIYEMFVEQKLIPQAIADRLNQRGVPSEYGRPWTRALVNNIVTNPKYIGANVLNRRSYKLGASPKGQKNPPDRWILRENVFQPIVDVGMFRRAQEIARERAPRYTDDELLIALKKLLERTGHLSVYVIDQDPQTPSSHMYSDRFGSMFEAYRRIGYDHGRTIPVIELAGYTRKQRDTLIVNATEELTKRGAAVQTNAQTGILTVNGRFTLRVAAVKCVYTSVGVRWRFRLDSPLKTDFVVMARLAPANDLIQDYYLIRTAGWRRTRVTVGSGTDTLPRLYWFQDLSFLYGLIRN
jgi:DNA invertase Pin-like site-specific DNA recombinase